MRLASTVSVRGEPLSRDSILLAAWGAWKCLSASEVLLTFFMQGEAGPFASFSEAGSGKTRARLLPWKACLSLLVFCGSS